MATGSEPRSRRGLPETETAARLHLATAGRPISASFAPSSSFRPARHGGLLTAVDRGGVSALQPLLESRRPGGVRLRRALGAGLRLPANNPPVAKLLITYQAAVDTAIADGGRRCAACVGAARTARSCCSSAAAPDVAAAGAPRPLHDATRNGTSRARGCCCARRRRRRRRARRTARRRCCSPCARRALCPRVELLAAGRRRRGGAGRRAPLVCASGAAHAEAAEVVRLLLRARAARRAAGGGRRRAGGHRWALAEAPRLRRRTWCASLAHGSAAAAEETRGLWPTAAAVRVRPLPRRHPLRRTARRRRVARGRQVRRPPRRAVGAEGEAPAQPPPRHGAPLRVGRAPRHGSRESSVAGAPLRREHRRRGRRRPPPAAEAEPRAARRRRAGRRRRARGWTQLVGRGDRRRRGGGGAGARASPRGGGGGTRRRLATAYKYCSRPAAAARSRWCARCSAVLPTPRPSAGWGRRCWRSCSPRRRATPT